MNLKAAVKVLTPALAAELLAMKPSEQEKAIAEACLAAESERATRDSSAAYLDAKETIAEESAAYNDSKKKLAAMLRALQGD